MSSEEKELEEELRKAGNKLLHPPASPEELLPLLDEVESILSKVEQSPSNSVQTALSLSTKALVADELLRNSDADVKVAVASCISEITRITAPDAPYDDDQMKDIFQLIVSSFKDLSDNSSRSFRKRYMILETVAKVRSCVVMLDLECDSLIVEMFQHFLRAIRDYHEGQVFTSMETIMILVLEESEDISLELLNPILSCLKKKNKEFLPIARKLGAKVVQNCAVKLRPYLKQAVKSSGVPLDEYSKIIGSVCEGLTSTGDNNNDITSGEQLEDEIKSANASSDEADENKLATKSSDGAAQVPEEVVQPATDSATEKMDPESLKKQDSEAGKSVALELKGEEAAKKIGNDRNSSISSTEPSASSRVDGEREDEKLKDQRSLTEDVHSSSTAPSENGKENTVPRPSPKAIESQEDAPKYESQPKGEIQEDAPKVDPKKVSEASSDAETKARLPKNKENLVREDAPTDVAKKEPEGLKKEESSVQEEAPASAPKKTGETISDMVAKARRPNKKDSLVKEGVPTDVPEKAVEAASGKEAKARRPKKKDSTVKEDAPTVVPKKAFEAESDTEAKARWPKKKEGLVQEDAPTTSVPKKAAEAISDTKAKARRPNRKESLVKEDAPADVPKKASEAASDTEAKAYQPQRKKGLVQEDAPAKTSEATIETEAKARQAKSKKSLVQENAPTGSPKKASVETSVAEAKVRRPKKKDTLVQEDADVPSKASEATSDAEAKSHQPRRAKGSVHEDAHSDAPKRASEATTRTEAKSRQGKRKKSVVQEDATTGAPKKASEGTSDTEAKARRPKKKERLLQEDTETDVPKKASEATSDTEAKDSQGSGKKLPVEIDMDDTIPTAVDSSTKESGATKNSMVGKSSSKRKAGESRGLEGNLPEHHVAKSSAKGRAKFVSTPKSAKSAKGEDHSKETPEMPSKREHSLNDKKASGTLGYGKNLVGLKVKVWWPDDSEFYEGVIASFDYVKKRHKVSYLDGDEEILNLKKETFEFLESDFVSDGQQDNEDPIVDTSPEIHKSKKSKSTPESSAKPEKMAIRTKRGKGGRSGKTKGTSSRTKQKTKDNTEESKGKSEEITDGESDDDVPITAIKSKDVDGGGTPKTTAPKTVNKSKGKRTTKIGGKSDENSGGGNKVQSSSSKEREPEKVDEKSPDSEKVPENVKKSGDAVKARGIGKKSVKKRRRFK